MLCTLSQWEHEPHEAEYEAISPSGQLHYLCTRHLTMYGHRYSHPIPLSESRIEVLTNPERQFDRR